jgi:fumarylacetoacetase
MPNIINETHDPTLTSWVESANAPESDFPIQNLPFGVFRRRGSDEPARGGVAIGDQILDLAACVREGLLRGPAAERSTGPVLNGLLALGPAAWAELRKQISRLLRADSPAFRADGAFGTRILAPAAEAELLLPVDIGDYTDAYASVFHATNIGSMFRPDNPLLPNYKYVPIAYHGRASSIVVSGAPVRRPSGQTRPDPEGEPRFGPCAALDYELELGFFAGPGNPLGQPIPIAEADRHIFGVCLVNDWSARDIQRWEYQPLGPFLAKSFATTISPWIVALEALAPFRAPAFQRPAGDPPPLPYQLAQEDQERGAIDITLEVYLRTAKMRASGADAVRLSRGSFADMYWTIAQLLTHHASNGCNLRPGDLIASGTVSGPRREARGCLQELTWGGREPVELPGGEQRRFLQDGDEVIVRGYCERAGFRRIGLGECIGEVASSQISEVSTNETG